MGTVLLVHRWLAYGMLVALVAVLAAGVGLRIVGREESPPWIRALQHWTENLLLANVVIGVVLLIGGRRAAGELAVLHYLYGSLFPFVALVGGRIAALRRERHDYVGLAWGAFFALGLVSRAVLLGLESTGRSLFDLL